MWFTHYYCDNNYNNTFVYLFYFYLVSSILVSFYLPVDPSIHHSLSAFLSFINASVRPSLYLVFLEFIHPCIQPCFLLSYYRKSSIKPPSQISPPFQRRKLISPPSLLSSPPPSPPILILQKKIND